MIYKIAFENSPLGLALLSLNDGRFIDVNPRFCQIVQREPDQLIGTPWSVIAGLSDRALITARINDFQKEISQTLCCDLSVQIEFEEEQAQDVALISIHDMTEFKAAQSRANWHADQLEAVLDAVPAAIWFLHDVNGEVFTANKIARQWFNDSPELNSTFCESSGYNEALAVFCDAKGREVKISDVPLMRAVRGENVHNFEGCFKFKDGRKLDVSGNALPWLDENGAIRGAVSAYVDVSERKRAEVREHLLAREVDHRARNILSVVQAIIQLTKSASVDDFRHSLTGRIDSLARAHMLLADGRWRGVDLRKLVDEEMAPYMVGGGEEAASQTITISGPDIALTPGAAQALALTLHELATNAAKYGALTAPNGKILIDWDLGEDGEDSFSLCWWEYQGRPTSEPEKGGFGGTLIRTLIEDQLDGKLSYHWQQDGLKVDICCPINTVTGAPPESRF
jgi:two-component sensor histidine kinase/PAS domain-containing protein